MTETVRVTPTDTHWRIPHQRPEAEEPEAEEWQLVSLASHELRTPLTALRTEVELALLGDRDASELRAALRSAADEIRRVCRLADDMLLLAQADQGRLPLRPRALEPRALLAAAATRARAAACAGALLASGASSSSVGTYAGQVVMAGFTNLRIPLTARRATPCSRPDHPGNRHQCHQRPGPEPGCAVLRHPVRPGAAGRADQQGLGHGPPREPPQPVNP